MPQEIKSINGFPIVPSNVEDGSIGTADLADGAVTLDKLDSALKSEINRDSHPLHVVRIGRLLDRFGYEGVSRRLYSQSVCTYNGMFYSLGSYDSNAAQNLTSFTSAGAIDTSKTFTELGHANSFVTDGSVFVVADGSGPKLHVVDFATWDYVRTITFSSFTNILSVSIYDGTVYFWARDASKMYVVSLSDTSASATYTILCTINSVGMIGVRQNFCVYDGYAYFLYGYSGYVYKIEIATGNVYDSFYVQGVYGELEDILMVDGHMCVTAPYHLDTSHEQACFVNLFQTDILNPVTSYESQPIIHEHLVVRVNGTAATTINPTDTFNTFEEACYLLNANHGGTLRAQNTTAGSIILFDGVYSVVPVSGGYTANDVFVYNSVVNFRQLTYATGYIYASTVAMTSVHIGGANDVSLSQLRCVSCTFDVGWSISSTRSQFSFEKTQSVSNGSVSTAASGVTSVASINGAYCAGIMKLAKLNKAYQAEVKILSSALRLTCYATAANLAATNYTLSTGDATYPSVHVNDGNVYVVDASNVETELTSGANIYLD